MLRRCDSKKIFGITIHKNMSAEDLKQAWDSVPKDQRNKFPEITNIIAAATMAEKLVTEIVPKYETAKKALEVQKEVVLTAAASTAGNVTYPLTKAAEAAAKTSITQLGKEALDSVQNAANTIMNKMFEAGGCTMIDENNKTNAL